mgnify:CR=1 FL=1
MCDNCGREYSTTYNNYNNRKKKSALDYCSKCISIKRKETCLKRYGVSSPLKNEKIMNKVRETNLKKYGFPVCSKNKDVIEKIKQTNLKKYGCSCSLHNDSIAEKTKNTNKIRYGCENYLSSDDYKIKTKLTNLERYGVTHYSKTQEYKEKMEQKCMATYGVRNYGQVETLKDKRLKTNILKYGVKYPLQNKVVFQKVKDTCLKKYGTEYYIITDECKDKITLSLYKHGNCMTSANQFDIYTNLKSEYSKCELNYPCGRYNLDIMIVTDSGKIDIEYDGWYWHKDKQDKDKIRDKYILDKGYKIIRFICKKNEYIDKDFLLDTIESMKSHNSNIKIINYEIK